MGASGWEYFVPYQPDIEAALQTLRQEVFKRGEYYTPLKFFRMVLEKIGATMSEDQRKQLLIEIQKAEKRPLPQSIEELIAMSGEDGTHSILDIEHVAAKPDFSVAAPLSPQESRRIFGTEQPTYAQIEQHAEALSQLRARWVGTYVIVYKDCIPDEIYFTGYSGD